MRVLILMGSMRKKGNTAELAKPFTATLTEHGVQVKTIWLRDLSITPCDACWACQYVPDRYGCAKDDDMQSIATDILSSDCIILATPIYSFFCTAPMKAMLDRHYGMNKYYGDTPGPSLWEGKKTGIIATCGYEPTYAASPFEDAVKKLCEHSRLAYIGMLAVRDEDDRVSFQTEEAVGASIAFAQKVIHSCSPS